MTHRSDVLAGVERQLLSLVALPGQAVRTSSLDGPRHLLRVVSALVRDGDPEPLVGIDGDGDVQAQWYLAGARLTVVVDDDGNGYLWAVDDDEAELLYAEWRPAQHPVEAWAAAQDLIGRGPVCARTPQDDDGGASARVVHATGDLSC